MHLKFTAGEKNIKALHICEVLIFFSGIQRPLCLIFLSRRGKASWSNARRREGWGYSKRTER